jgi:CRP/FNR family cyclic AMP-dependent transcriptional regulator
MVQFEKPTFNAAAFLAHAGLGRKVVQVVPRETFFSQGDPADSVFYLQDGRAKITVVSQAGKEATVALLSAGDFVGEESLAAAHGLRLATTKAITACTALKISREEMIRVMHEEHEFSDLFLKFLLARSMRTQADLVDQLFNSSEKRLARFLLLMAEFGRPGEPQTLIPKISQETLAEMIGTTRSRVSFFMNRFRKLGFIEYDGRIRVHRSLLKCSFARSTAGRRDRRSVRFWVFTGIEKLRALTISSAVEASEQSMPIRNLGIQCIRSKSTNRWVQTPQRITNAGCESCARTHRYDCQA